MVFSGQKHGSHVQVLKEFASILHERLLLTQPLEFAFHWTEFIDFLHGAVQEFQAEVSFLFLHCNNAQAVGERAKILIELADLFAQHCARAIRIECVKLVI